MLKTTCLAFLSADRTWVENTGKIGVAGIFDNFTFENFPVQAIPFGFYVRLANVAKGFHSLQIDIGRENEQIAVMILTIEHPSDLDIFQVQIPTPAIVFPAPGVYKFVLKYDNEEMYTQVVGVTKKESEQ